MWYARLTFEPPPAAAKASSEGTNTVTPAGSGAATTLVKLPVEFCIAEAKPVTPIVLRVSEKESGTVKKLCGAQRHESVSQKADMQTKD